MTKVVVITSTQIFMYMYMYMKICVPSMPAKGLENKQPQWLRK